MEKVTPNDNGLKGFNGNKLKMKRCQNYYVKYILN